METQSVVRKWEECGDALHGRADKKFCSDMCKTAAHNRKRAEQMRNMPECIIVIQKTLLNNYHILTTLRKRGEQFSLMYLKDLGFSVQHMTSMTQRDGILKCHCFNESYILTEQALILLND